MCRQLLAKSSSTFSSSTSEDLAESPTFSNFMSAGCESECDQSTLQKACDERDQAKRRVEELELELNTLKERLTPGNFLERLRYIWLLVELLLKAILVYVAQAILVFRLALSVDILVKKIKKDSNLKLSIKFICRKFLILVLLIFKVKSDNFFFLLLCTI